MFDVELSNDNITFGCVCGGRHLNRSVVWFYPSRTRRLAGIEDKTSTDKTPIAYCQCGENPNRQNPNRFEMWQWSKGECNDELRF